MSLVKELESLEVSNMNVKRYVTGLIGFPIVACALIFGNKYVIDALFAIVAVFALYEYNNALKLKAKPVLWLRICFLRINRIYTYNTN